MTTLSVNNFFLIQIFHDNTWGHFFSSCPLLTVRRDLAQHIVTMRCITLTCPSLMINGGDSQWHHGKFYLCPSEAWQNSMLQLLADKRRHLIEMLFFCFPLWEYTQYSSTYLCLFTWVVCVGESNKCTAEIYILSYTIILYLEIIQHRRPKSWHKSLNIFWPPHDTLFTKWLKLCMCYIFYFSWLPVQI